MTQTRLLIDDQLKGRLITGAIEVVENTQSLHRIQRNTLGTEVCKWAVRSAPTLAKYARASSMSFLAHGDGHILFLRNAVCSGGLIKKHIVVLHAVPSSPSCFIGMRMESSKSALFSL
jgi:hypothetical protein